MVLVNDKVMAEIHTRTSHNRSNGETEKEQMI